MKKRRNAGKKLDDLTKRLISLGEHKFIEEVYDTYDIFRYAVLPPIITASICDVLEERVEKIEEAYGEEDE